MSDAPSAAQLPQALLGFQRALQHCRSPRELQFALVNEAYSLLHYDQAVLATPGLTGRLGLVAVSGLAEVDINAPFAQWFTRLAAWLVTQPGKVIPMTPAQMPADLADSGADWVPAHALACKLSGPDGNLAGLLWFAGGDSSSAQAAAVGDWIADAAGHAMWSWRARKPASAWLKRLFTGRRAWYVATAVAVLIVFPVRLSVLAPAEVTPLNPTPITAPADGVVQRVWVEPNQRVKSGEVLVTLDDTVTRNRLLVAGKSLEIAQAELQRATGKAFVDDQSKSELQILDARVKEKAAEVTYLTELLQRIRMTAPREGIAIFADPLDWLGKPVQTGERIMLLSDPAAVELTLYVPADDAIQLDAGTAVRMFLNISPLSSLNATVTQTSYEAVATPDGALAYVLKARLDEHAPPRIGLKGTAKLYAGYVPLVYYVLRKPLAWLRRAAGL
ncbi:MAG: hypothetical protein JWN94_1099 [Betaproteobacteria bacterium]|nr:hypothetical protein [Betaproteobacteria bacterium]